MRAQRHASSRRSTPCRQDRVMQSQTAKHRCLPRPRREKRANRERLPRRLRSIEVKCLAPIPILGSRTVSLPTVPPATPGRLTAVLRRRRVKVMARRILPGTKAPIRRASIGMDDAVDAGEIVVPAAITHSSNSSKSRSYPAAIRKDGSSRRAMAASYAARRTAISPRLATHGFRRCSFDSSASERVI